MRSRTVVIILVVIASIGVSQLPYSQTEGNNFCEPDCTHEYLSPCPIGQTCGFTATTTVLYWDSFPLYWFGEIGLVIILIKTTGDVKYELRQLDQEETETIPVAPHT